MAKRKRKKLIREDQVERLLEATRGERFETRDRAILELLYAGGLRVGELCSLEVPDIDLARGRVTVTGKGQKTRTVPLGQRSVAACRAYLQARREGPLFRTAQGKPPNNRLVQRIVAKYARMARLPHISPHSLRHSAASHMLRRGAYLFSVKEFLGHVHPTTTARYCHELGPRQPLHRAYAASHPRA